MYSVIKWAWCISETCAWISGNILFFFFFLISNFILYIFFLNFYFKFPALLIACLHMYCCSENIPIFMLTCWFSVSKFSLINVYISKIVMNVTERRQHISHDTKLWRCIFFQLFFLDLKRKTDFEKVSLRWCLSFCLVLRYIDRSWIWLKEKREMKKKKKKQCVKLSCI